MTLAERRGHMTDPHSTAEPADILVAEDDPIVAKLLSHTLSRRGLRFTTRRTGSGPPS